MATQEETQSVNHQLALLCQPSGALFMVGAVNTDYAVDLYDIDLFDTPRR